MALLAAAALAVTASSVLYSWIWMRPHSFMALVAPLDACKTMSLVSNALKLLQFALIAACTDWHAAAALPLPQLALGAALLLLGQHLNALVYYHLGVDGVYYGSRFGKKLPWVSAYPYNVIRDPQYVGSALSCLGAAAVIPVEIVIVWLVNYAYLMWLEHKLPAGSSSDAAAAAAAAHAAAHVSAGKAALSSPSPSARRAAASAGAASPRSLAAAARAAAHGRGGAATPAVQAVPAAPRSRGDRRRA